MLVPNMSPEFLWDFCFTSYESFFERPANSVWTSFSVRIPHYVQSSLLMEYLGLEHPAIEWVSRDTKGESTESWNPEFHWIPVDSKDSLGFLRIP